MRIDKEEVLLKIKEAAKNYKRDLVGKTFLYVFNNRYIEVIFKANNFMHLSGVEPLGVSPKDFLQLALKNELTVNQFTFSHAHPYHLYKRKSKHLADISNLTTTECYMLEEITTDTTVYKFGATDMNMTICFNKPTDKDGNIKGTVYNAFSLRDKDCVSKSKNGFPIDYVFEKNNDESEYSKIVFIDKKANISKIPNEIKAKVEKVINKKI